MDSLKPPPPPPISSNQQSVADSPQSGDRFLPSPKPIIGDLRTHSLIETHKLEERNGDEPIFLREQSRRTESAKAVQLITWRDLPGKEDYYGATNNRLMLGTSDHNSESHKSGSELVNSAGDPYAESLSMQEENSLPSSGSTTRERQLTAALKSNVVAFTSF